MHEEDVSIPRLVLGENCSLSKCLEKAKCYHLLEIIFQKHLLGNFLKGKRGPRRSIFMIPVVSGVESSSKSFSICKCLEKVKCYRVLKNIFEYVSGSNPPPHTSSNSNPKASGLIQVPV